MSKKKPSIRNIALVICTAMLFVLLAFAFAACGGGKSDDYYLSLASKNWQTYTSQKDIPEELHFEQNGNERNIYTLTVYMDENEQFTINKLGSDIEFGYSKLFSISDELTPGSDGSIKVAEKGTYSFILDVDNNLTYEYAAEILSVSISKSVTSMLIGDSYKFGATVSYANGSTGSSVTWSSDNESVCTVAANGMVSAHAEGDAKITATAGEFSASVDVSVSLNPVPATGVSLDRTELFLEMGESDTLVATVEPRNAINKDVLWDVTDANVVTITQDGVITAVGYGTTTVTVSTASGGFSAQCHVTVSKHATAIKLDPSNVTVAVNGASRAISVSFSPSDATDADYTFEVTSGDDKAEVTQSGNTLNVTGLQVGEATLVVSSVSNADITATCTIHVVGQGEPVASIQENLKLMIDEETTLTATLENATIATVDWEVEHSEVATITNGTDASTITVTALQFGSTQITATITDDEGETYELTSNLLVADDFFFIYGYGLGAYDWDSADYLADSNAAAKANILFDEYSTGVYKLTRHLTPDNGFQIIFPMVNNYTELDSISGENKWNKNIPSDMVPNSTYYDADRSDRSFVATRTLSQFGVTAAGVYTITLDLTGTSAKVYINKVSIDVTSVTLVQKSGSTMLRSGATDVFGYSFAPTTATFDPSDWKIEVLSDFADYTQYIDWSVNEDSREITVTAKGDFTSPFILRIRVALKDQEAVELVSVYPANYEEDPVTEIAFEHDHYSFNVNNGGEAWELQVKAAVNDNATVQAVNYSIYDGGTGSNVSINADGLVTARRLGTFTVLATAVGNEDYRATCTVTFYSDTFYLSGEYNGQTDNFKACDPASQELDSTHRGTKFEMVSETYYRLTYEFNGELNSVLHTNWEYGFQVLFLGMDAKWESRFTAYQADCFDANTNFDFGNAPNVRVKVAGEYIIEVDLSTSTPKWCINKVETPLSRIDLKASSTELHADESAQVVFSTFPKFAEIPDGESLVWTLEGNEENYVIGSFDEETKMYSVTVNTVPHAADAVITLKCTVGSVTASVKFTIVSEHHLVQKSDQNGHWLECTDGDGYTEGLAGHQMESDLTSTDPAGHYTKCSVCGYHSDLTPHTLTLNSGVFDFTTCTECSACGFKFFEITDGVLTRYDAKAAKVKIPDSVTEIAAGVFEGHTEITKIEFSDASQLKTIGERAFKDCSSILSIWIPCTVTEIGKSAFSGVSALVLWKSNPTIGKLDGFEGYLGTSIEIPASVWKICNGAFSGSNLTSIVIPDTVNSIEGYAFQGCPKLKTIVFGTKIQYLTSPNVVSDCPSLEKVYFMCTTFYQCVGSFSGCNALQAVYFARSYSGIKSVTTMFQDDVFGYIRGKCYAYADSDPGADVDFGDWSDYFVGTWHYEGEEKPENAVIWEHTDTASIGVTLFFEDRTKYEA